METGGIILTYYISDRFFIDAIEDRASISARIKLVASIAELIVPGLGYETAYCLNKYDLEAGEEMFGSDLWFKIGELVMCTNNQVHFTYHDGEILGIIKNGGN